MFYLCTIILLLNYKNVLIVYYMYVETTETRSLIYTSSNHTAYHVCCMAVKAYHSVFCSYMNWTVNVIWNNAFRCIFNCCWRESVKPLQFYCNTVPLSYMIEERKLLFYRNISRSKNVILKILMCLTGVLSDYMFLCSKYGVNCASSKSDIKDAVMRTLI